MTQQKKTPFTPWTETPWYLSITPDPVERQLVIYCKDCREHLKIIEAYPDSGGYKTMEIVVEPHVCKKDSSDD